MAAFGDAPLIGPGSELQLDDRRPGGSARRSPRRPRLGAFARARARRRSRPGWGRGSSSATCSRWPSSSRRARPRRRRGASTRRFIARSATGYAASSAGRPLVRDLDGDVIAAYARHLETAGGRGGRPAALATRRIYLAMVRALARELGREETSPRASRCRATRPGRRRPMTEPEYENLLRVPDRRARSASAITRCCESSGTAGCAPRSCAAWSRGICATTRERPPPPAPCARQGRHRARSSRARGDPRGAGGLAGRASPRARPRRAARRGAVFVRLGRYPGAERPEPLSAQAVHKLVRRCALAAGVPERLAHPHALRTYWATSLLEDGVAIHRVPTGSGTPTCGPPAATPPSTLTKSMTSPTCSIAATKRRNAPIGRRSSRAAERTFTSGTLGCRVPDRHRQPHAARVPPRPRTRRLQRTARDDPRAVGAVSAAARLRRHRRRADARFRIGHDGSAAVVS